MQQKQRLGSYSRNKLYGGIDYTPSPIPEVSNDSIHRIDDTDSPTFTNSSISLHISDLEVPGNVTNDGVTTDEYTTMHSIDSYFNPIVNNSVNDPTNRSSLHLSDLNISDFNNSSGLTDTDNTLYRGGERKVVTLTKKNRKTKGTRRTRSNKRKSKQRKKRFTKRCK
jgi:hypothetical protein